VSTKPSNTADDYSHSAISLVDHEFAVADNSPDHILKAAAIVAGDHQFENGACSFTVHVAVDPVGVRTSLLNKPNPSEYMDLALNMDNPCGSMVQ